MSKNQNENLSGLSPSSIALVDVLGIQIEYKKECIVRSIRSIALQHKHSTVGSAVQSVHLYTK
jgi:hypothetical protein